MLKGQESIMHEALSTKQKSPQARLPLDKDSGFVNNEIVGTFGVGNLSIDYSWDDQEPEQLQTWHEFQGELLEPSTTDGVAFPSLSSETSKGSPLEDNRERMDEDEDEDEIYLYWEMSDRLEPLELEVVCHILGITVPKLTLEEVAVEMKITVSEVSKIYESARRNLNNWDFRRTLN